MTSGEKGGGRKKPVGGEKSDEGKKRANKNMQLVSCGP